jgi:glycosyltransferase involved in cell wall biosynthesis
MPKLDQQKIIFLFTPGPIGGAEKVVASGLKALIAKGIKASLWVIKEERAPEVTEAFIVLLKSEGVAFKVFSSRGIFDSVLLNQLKSAFKAEAPAIIHAHGFKSAFYGHLAKPKNSEFIITHHGKTSHTFKVKVYEFIELQIMKRASTVIAVSTEMKGMLTKDGVKADIIQVVENLMTSKVVNQSNSRDEKLKLLFVGRLSPEKGCLVLVEALKLLPKHHFEVSILGDGVQRNELESEASDLGVTFLGFRKNVVEIIAQHDALVMPSYREGQPLTLIEACCMGMPVVASNVGGIPELISDGINGILFEAGSAQKLSKALVQLETQFGKLKETAESKKQHFTQRFSPENWADRSIEVYQIVLSQL